MYVSDDKHITRMLSGSHQLVVKPYRLEDDTEQNYCLFTLLKYRESLIGKYSQITANNFPSKEKLIEILKARDSVQMAHLVDALKSIRKELTSYAEKPSMVLSKTQKALELLQLFEHLNQHRAHTFHATSHNCVYATLRTEDFITTFFDAKIDADPLLKVWERLEKGTGKEVHIDTLQYSTLKKIRDVFARFLIHVSEWSYLGYFLGRGKKLGVIE